MSAISVQLIQRLLLERDLRDSRMLSYMAADGSEVEFELKTLTRQEKDELKALYDKTFPVPPIAASENGTAQFDLESTEYQIRLSEWSQSLTYGILAKTIGIEADGIRWIECHFPPKFVTELFSTVELINGIHSDPLADLVRESMWAPEVLAWVETSKPKHPDLKLSETALYREIDCMIAAGLSMEQWNKLSPRERMIYMNWNDYTKAKEGYISDFFEKKGDKRVQFAHQNG